MPNVWPDGKGPTAGICEICCGEIRKRWSCHIMSEYYCTNCGTVNGPRRWPTLNDRERLKHIVDEVYEALSHQDRTRVVHLGSFMRTVNLVTMRKFKNWSPSISKREFSDWGYVIEYETIRKVRV